jgi:hypothetical protein
VNPEDCTFIIGFGLAGYRSFGPGLQRIGPCRKINLLVGQNNSGKSNILRFIHDYYAKIPDLTRNSQWELRDLEKFRTTKPCDAVVTAALKLDEKQPTDLQKLAASKGHQAELQRFIEAIAQNKCGSGFWFDSAFAHSVG